MINGVEVMKARHYGELLLLGIKANGGYKFRNMIKLPDTQVKDLTGTCEEAIRDMIMRLTVAEAMLKEPPPHYHCRWDDYQERLREARQLIREHETQARKGLKSA